MSLPNFLHIVKNFTCSVFEKYHLTRQLKVKSRQVKCGLREKNWCSRFSMGVCRDMKNCILYAGVQCTQVFNLTGSTVLTSKEAPKTFVGDICNN